MVKLWVRCELFDFAILPFPASTRVDIPALYELAATLRQSERTGHANKLFASEWVAAAKTCLNMSEQHALLYFDVFDVVISQNPSVALQKSREMLAVWQADEPTAAFRRPTTHSVQLYEFLVFLFVQLFSRDTPRKREDVFPSAGGPGAFGQAASSTSPRNLSARAEEVAYIAFVKQHLVQLLHLLLSDGATTTMISKQQVDRLGVLVAGGPNLRTETTFLSSLTAFWDSGNRLVPVSDVAEWLSASMTGNPLLYPSLQPNSPSRASYGSDEGAGDDALPRPTTVHAVHKRTVVKGENDVRHGTVRIVGCTMSNIYIVAPCRYVLVSNCANCTIFVGAVQHVLLLEQTERTRVIATTRMLRVNSCTDLTLNVCTNYGTVLGGQNHGVVLGPFQTFYPKLEPHLLRAGVNPLLNRWRAVLLAGVTPHSVDEGRKPYKFMPPEQLLPFAVPFSMSGPTVQCPVPLPEEYEEALATKQVAVEHLRKQVATVARDENVRRELQATVESLFRDWLAASGNMRQVHDLLRAPSEL